MTNYYVRVTGSDAAAGTSPAAAWATIAHAIDNLTAGDTVYIGPGYYYHNDPAHSDYAGSNGSPIVFQGDPHGAYTGDAPGPVIIGSAKTDFSRVGQYRSRLMQFDGNAKWLEFHDLVFTGGSSTNNMMEFGGAAGYSLEGIVVEDCMFFQLGSSKYGQIGSSLHFDFGNGLVTPTVGPRVRRCYFTDGLTMRYTGNAGGPSIDLDFEINACVVSDGGFLRLGGTGGTYSCHGLRIIACSSISNYHEGISIFQAYYPVYASGHLFAGLVSDGAGWIGIVGGSANTIVAEYIQPQMGVATMWTQTPYVKPGDGLNFQQEGNTYGCWWGYELNYIYEKYFGINPFNMWEPLDWFGYKNTAIGGGHPGYKPTLDYYGRPFGVNRNNSYVPVGWFNGDFVSDQFPVLYTWTDPDSSFTGEDNLNENDYEYVTYSAAGTINTDYLRVQQPSVNINANQIIHDVYIRPMLYMSGLAGEMYFNFYTANEAENLGTLTFSASADDLHWHDLQKIPNKPAGGWTVSAIENLEFRTWRNGEAGSFRAHKVVIYLDTGQHDIGAVASRGDLQVEPSGNDSDQSLKIVRGGFYQTTCPVVANQEITISVDCWIDANYDGDPPSLQVYHIPGSVSEESDTHNGFSESWDSLSVTFTPTLNGYATIRTESFDESYDGETFFDNLTWS